MARLLLLSVFAASAFALTATAEDPPKSSNPPAKTDGDVIVSKVAAGDLSGMVTKVSASQITLKVPQQVQSGFTTRSVRVPNPARPGQTHTVRQQVPQYKTVQQEYTFDIGATATVKTAAGKVTDLTSVQAGQPAMIHLTRVKEAKVNEKPESHLEVTRIVVPTVPAVATSSTPKKK